MTSSSITYDPEFKVIFDTFDKTIDTMVNTLTKLPAVENLLFQQMESLPTKHLSYVKRKEKTVLKAKKRMRTALEANAHGPMK